MELLGGRWWHGGDAGEYAPCQLTYPTGIKLELISPGSAGDGFMRRFLDARGPGPHHLTFNVADIEATLAAFVALRIEPLGRVRMGDFREEAFLHPKTTGIGTLLQVVQMDESYLATFDPPPPAGFPEPAASQPASFAWIGLTVESVHTADALFLEILDATLASTGADWRLYDWGPGRRLMVRERTAAPGHAAMWSDVVGVDHLLLGPAELDTAGIMSAAMQRLDRDDRIGLAIWAVAS